VSQLRQRILAARQDVVGPEPVEPQEEVLLQGDPLDDILVPEAPPTPPEPRASLDPEVHAEVHKRVVRDLGPMLFDNSVRDDELEDHLREIIVQAFEDAGQRTRHRVL